MEFSHVVAQELLGGSGRDLTAVRDQARRKLDIGLGSIHLGRVAKAEHAAQVLLGDGRPDRARRCADDSGRSEEHTSELQSLMRISYAVFCLKTKKTKTRIPLQRDRTSNNN